MKKALFTFCSIVTVCGLIFMACKKDEDAKYKTDYASKTTVGTGGNPNPNNNPSSTGYGTGGTTTSTTSTVSTCSKTLAINGTACTGISCTIASNVITESAGCGSVVITFAGTSAPSSGTYVVVSSAPGAGQCNFSLGSQASGGTVSVTTGTTNKATFSGIICGTSTVTGTACY